MARRVVVVTLDGVRWQDVFMGADHDEGPGKNSAPLLPNLHMLVRSSGAAFGGPQCPHDVRVTSTSLSLPGYFEIFSGQRALTCFDNDCARIKVDTFIDDARRLASGPTDIAVFASWAPYARAVARDPVGVTIFTGASSTLAAGVDPRIRATLTTGPRGKPYPGFGDYRPDEYTARSALRYLELFRPHMLVIGLGDADEYAHRSNLVAYRRAIRSADDMLQELVGTISRMDSSTATSIIVTTDHGRGGSVRDHGPGFPESDRVFVVAFGARVARRGFSCARGPLRLADIAPVVRVLGGFPREGDELTPLAREILAVE